MNPAAFANPPVVAFNGQTDLTPLGGERGQLYGPGFHRLDFSAFKEFRPTERTRLEFRAEFFNLFNRVEFGLPDTNFGDATFGVISTQANIPRQIQFGLKFYW